MYRILFSYFSLIMLACNPQTKSKINVNYQDIIVKDSILSAYNLDSFSVIINTKCELWMKSWSVSFKVNDFKYEGEGELKSADQWVDTKTDKAYLSLYKDLLYYSVDNLMCLDIYSYKVGLTMEGNTLVGVFDADTKVNIMDMSNKKTRLLITAGTVATYDDCVWLDKNTFLLLGSYSEFVGDKECFNPFIFVYDIHNNYYWKYLLNKPIDKLNEQFFFKRFPMIKIK